MSQLSYSPGEALGAVTSEKKRWRRGSAHRNPTSGQGTQGITDSRPRRTWGRGDGHGDRSLQTCSLQTGQAAARGQMGCISLGAGSSGPRCSVLSRRAGFGLRCGPGGGGRRGWVTAPDVCRPEQRDDCGTQWQHPGPRGLELRGLGQGGLSVCISSAHLHSSPWASRGFRVHRTLTQQLPSQEASRPHS